MASLSTHAMDVVERIEDDVKVVKMPDMTTMEGVHVKRPPGIQQTQLDVLGTDLRRISSHAQALDAMRQAGREHDRAKRVRLQEEKGLNEQEQLDQHCEQHTASEVVAVTHRFVLLIFLSGYGRKRCSDKGIEEERTSVTEALQQIVGTDWSELDETAKSGTAKALQDRFKPY